MGQAREMQKLIDANWHAIYKMRKLIAAKLNSFTVFQGRKNPQSWTCLAMVRA